jgi:hypothetical protein
MTYDLALSACRTTGTPYFAVKKNQALSDAQGQVVAIMFLGSKCPRIEVFTWPGGQAIDGSTKTHSVFDAESAPPEIRTMQFQPYTAGSWHLPLDPEARRTLECWKPSR